MTAGAPPPVPPRTSRTALDGIAASRVRTNRNATVGILHASGRTADLRERGRVQTKAKYREKYHQPEISHDLSFARQSESSEVPTSNQYATTPSSERSASLAKCVASRVILLEDRNGDLIKRNRNETATSGLAT